MNYISTRGNYKKVTSAEAIKVGMVPEGGLFVPENFPVIDAKEIEKMENMSYQDIAEKVFKQDISAYKPLATLKADLGIDDLPDNVKSCQDIIEYRNMNGAQSNIFKVAFTFNAGRHNGTNEIRDLYKVIYFAKREINRIKKLNTKE